MLLLSSAKRYGCSLFIKRSGIWQVPGSLVLLMVIVLASGCRSGSPLISDGKSDYSIFVSDKAAASEKTAAAELQVYLEKISGCRLPVVNATSEGSRFIYVGFKEAPEHLLHGLDPAGFGPEEYIIRSNGKQLLIAGGSQRGTLYGVVGYLKDHPGCRWYTQTVEKIPSLKTIVLRTAEDRQKPDFQYREVNWREAYEAGWSVHNRVIPSRLSIPDSLGGSFVIFPERGHTFNVIIPPTQYFKTHPEYFSEINGIRTADDAQLCLTNPDVLRLTVEKVLEWKRLRPDASVYSISQNDNEQYCTCSRCKKVDEEEGSPAGTLIRFINRVSEEVTRTHPDIKIHTFAYTYSEVPPLHVRPAGNVLIELCHYNYCSAHSINGCKDHNKFTGRLEKWLQIAKNVTVWGYYVDFGFYLMPFPNFESLRKDVKYFKEKGSYGLYTEGCNIIGPKGGGEFSELKAWVFAQLMWDASLDADMLIKEYLENVYGNASQPIAQYINLLQEQVKDTSVYFNIWSSPVDVSYLTPATIARADELFDEARSAAGADQALLKRVEDAYLPVLFTKLYFNAFGGGENYLRPGEAVPLADRFGEIVKEKEIQTLGSNESMPDLINALITRTRVSEKFFKEWWIAGPFESDEKRTGFDNIYEPEKNIDTTQLFSAAGRKFGWIRHKTGALPYIDFSALLTPNENAVAYAYTNIYAPEDKVVRIGAGSNDGIKVWINNRLVLSNRSSRRAAVDQDIIEVSLKKGNNTVLVKVDQLKRGWGFYLSEIQSGADERKAE